MKSVVNQFRRIFNDHGQNDKSFDHKEIELRGSLTKLRDATDKLIMASNSLSDLLRREPKKKRVTH